MQVDRVTVITGFNGPIYSSDSDQKGLKMTYHISQSVAFAACGLLLVVAKGTDRPLPGQISIPIR